MDLRDERWFVRFRGHTLGPLRTDQVKSSLRNRELSEADKVSSAQNPGWFPLGEHPDFAPFARSLREDDAFRPLPSPEAFRRKARAVLAAVPTPALEEGEKPATAVSAPLFSHASDDRAPAPEPAPAPAKPRSSARLQAVRPVAEPPVRSVAELVAPVFAEAPASVGKPREEEDAGDKQAASVAAPVPAPVAAPVATPAPVAESASAPTPAPAARKPELGEESRELMASLREFQRQKGASPASTPTNKPVPASRVVIAPPAPEPAAPALAPDTARAWVVLTKRDLVMAGLLAALVAALVFLLTQKTRGPESPRFPDPSTPSARPAEPGDPIPALRAPTRPRRE